MGFGFPGGPNFFFLVSKLVLFFISKFTKSTEEKGDGYDSLDI